MRMTVTEIEQTCDGVYVTGSTSIGHLKGRWQNNKAPVSGETCFFELNIGDVPRGSITVLSKGSTKPKTSLINGQMHFIGLCETIDDDVYVIRFCTDWLEMLCIDNDDFSIKIGDSVSFYTDFKNIAIYPYSL